MYDAYKTLKITLLFIASLVGVYASGNLYWQAQRDPSPHAVDISRFGADDADHYWLAVSGYLTARGAMERQDYNPTASKAGAGTRYNVDVPLVPATWRPGDPVHVFARFGPYPRDEARRRARDAFNTSALGNYTLTGTQMSLEVERMFPELNVASDAVILQAGSTPPAPGASIFMGLICLVLCVITGRWLFLKWQQPTPPELAFD